MSTIGAQNCKDFQQKERKSCLNLKDASFPNHTSLCQIIILSMNLICYDDLSR